MQSDMHFYGTYFLARAAGIPAEDAKTVAYAAQFVDDSTDTDTERHPDGGILVGTATVHTLKQVVKNAMIEQDEQRRVWVPFHFLPGGRGDSLEERLICVKDSEIANEMIGNHVSKAADSAFGLELLGLSAHVYMDTFAHYGFSGIGSEYNRVDGESCKPIDVRNPKTKAYVIKKKEDFIEKYLPFEVASWFAETASNSLGHGGVATFPDRPFLNWEVMFEKERNGEDLRVVRDNPADYMDACRKTHGYFEQFARMRYDSPISVEFGDVADEIETVIRLEGAKQDRSDKWLEAISANNSIGFEEEELGIEYDEQLWLSDIRDFSRLEKSEAGIDGSAYKFHQAASWHRHFVLKELLPKHRIAVY